MAHKHPLPGLASLFLMAMMCGQPREVAAQSPAQQTIGHTSATEVRVSGAVDFKRGELLLGNGSTVTAAGQPIDIALTRGGQLRLCSTTSLHLAKDRSIPDPENTGLMMALDRGAFEASYTVGKYSDVLLTPDLRILISGPGQADLSVRVNPQGDTCVDNHGANAPYVTVSSQLEGGIYRVLPNQRVMFEHGSLNDMVDHEPELCGCPVAPTIPVENASVSSKHPAQPVQKMGGPSSTPADTAFPIAESEGLAAPPSPPATPVVPVGQVHAQVTVPLIYNGENPPPVPTPVAPGAAPAKSVHSNASKALPAPSSAAADAAPPVTVAEEAAAPPVSSGSTLPTPAAKKPAAQKNDQRDLFHLIGHFFSHLFR